MKTTILALGYLLSVNAYAEMIPKLNCVASIQEEVLALQYRDGGAAFMNVYAAEINEYAFLTILNASNPIADSTPVPVTLMIGNLISGKTYKEKNVVMTTGAEETSIKAKLEDGKIATLSCSRLLH